MTTDEQRIAVAENCGIKHIYQLIGHPEKISFFDDVPNYPSDLNAMHEAEKVLIEKSKSVPEWEEDWTVAYSLNLLKIVAMWKKEGFGWGDVCDGDFFRIANATASQRCEAFLRTVGKWKE